MRKKTKKRSKFWDTMVDPGTKRMAERFIERIKQGKIIDIHRFRGFIETECGD